MSENQYAVLGRWYDSTKDLHVKLTGEAERLIQDLINNENIAYLSVTSRTKSRESFIEKVARKGYRYPGKEVTDLSGVRVITHIESNMERICNLIKSSLNVHKDKSVDKTDELGFDRVGYRSVHFVCDLGEDRVRLPEFSRFKDMVFEIQVRTMLQHAWAEMQHDRDYKFSGVLPNHLRRRLYCVAGTLELVDREFVNLVREIEDYSREIKERILKSDLDADINTTSLSEYLQIKLRQLENKDMVVLEGNRLPKIIIEELENFGVRTLSDLDRILSEDFFESVAHHQSYTTYAGLLRDAMIYTDIDHYFIASWQNNWHVAESYMFEILSEKYGNERVEKIFHENSITWN